MNVIEQRHFITEKTGKIGSRLQKSKVFIMYL